MMLYPSRLPAEAAWEQFAGAIARDARRPSRRPDDFESGARHLRVYFGHDPFLERLFGDLIKVY
jgi:hypothetical protein